jgi:hypothetical protein
VELLKEKEKTKGFIMADTFTEEAQKAEDQVKVEATETAEPKVEQPKGKVYTEDELRKAIEEARLEVRREHTKREQRIKELEEKVRLSDTQFKELGSLRSGQAELEEQIATLMDMVGGTTDTAQAQGSYMQRLREKRTKTQVITAPVAQPDIEARVNAAVEARRLDELVTEGGLDKDSEDVEYAKYLYSTKGYERTVKYLKELAVKAKATKEEPEVKPEPKKTAQQAIAEMKAAGVENPKPAASRGTAGIGSLSRKELAERMGNPDFLPWFKEHEKEIDEMMASGKLK